MLLSTNIFLSMVVLLCLTILSQTTYAHPSPSKRQLPGITLSPNLTCGRLLSPTQTYFCPTHAPCCSYHGYCGSSDAYCNTLAGCQSSHSNPTVPACHAPIDKVTASPNGKCGRMFEMTWGYRCPEGEEEEVLLWKYTRSL
ncbi:carbohydrate-binding module family 18 protein [Cadophora sp. DSE1049]|nr:carbohydrate-binding module family 18 protein [Cadophora sp. DSE1049]